ncbi:acetolactate synthase small subunit [Candidatus Bipolaricaulota bacterium]|nr:acetolactate synthase small subunit [Candidatus Bipolaricaulota bacterium]
MRHTLVAMVEDKPGVLNRMVSLFRRRRYNIESLAVGHSERPGISRMTLVVTGDDRVIDQVKKQLEKLVNVIEVVDVTGRAAVIRELALIRVKAPPARRGEITQIVDLFRARVVDVDHDSLMVEVTGPEEKVNGLITLLEPFGVEEVVRTGRVAMVRGAQAKEYKTTVFK